MDEVVNLIQQDRRKNYKKSKFNEYFEQFDED